MAKKKKKSGGGYLLIGILLGVFLALAAVALWPEKKAGNGVLKTAMYRLRAMLAESFGEEFGYEFLCCHNRVCSIGESFKPICDFEEFERYIVWAKQTQNEEEKYHIKHFNLK